MAKERLVIQLLTDDDIAMRDKLKSICGSRLVTMESIVKSLIREWLILQGE